MHFVILGKYSTTLVFFYLKRNIQSN